MTHFIKQLAIFALIFSPAVSSHAQEWQITKVTTQSGLKGVSVHITKHEFTFEFSCDEQDWQDHRLTTAFVGPQLPRLYGEQGATAKLSILFTRRGGVLYREPWIAEYESDGSGGGVWVGTINAGKSELDALASALKITILNEDAETVYDFPAKGTAAGVAEIRKLCQLGLE